MEGTATAVAVGDKVVEAVTVGRTSLGNMGEAGVVGVVDQLLLLAFP